MMNAILSTFSNMCLLLSLNQISTYCRYSRKCCWYSTTVGCVGEKARCMMVKKPRNTRERERWWWLSAPQWLEVFETEKILHLTVIYIWVIENCVLDSFLAWENRRHFATPPTVSPRKTSEKRAQKFHTDDASLPKSGQCFWLVEANFTSGTTNQKHYPNLGSDASSVRNFHVVVTLRIVVCFLRLHLSRTLCKRPLSGVSKSKCLPVFRSLPRRRSAGGTGTLEEALRTTSAWETMSFVQK